MTRGDRSSTAGLHRPSIDPVHRPPPSRRRPRRGESVTYRVRVELLGAQPPVWRRLELASDLFLDDVHEIRPVAFGWTDSHLHRFGCGPKYYSDDTEYYLMAYEVHEAETGIPEEQVRLDEVLVEVVDRLWYCYDFGDDWQHVVELEAVLPRPDSAGRAVCTWSPTRSTGGLRRRARRRADRRGDRTGRFRLRRAGCVRGFLRRPRPRCLHPDPARHRRNQPGTARFDVELDVDTLPGPLADLLDAVRTDAPKRRLHRLIATALAAPVLVEEEKN